MRHTLWSVPVALISLALQAQTPDQPAPAAASAPSPWTKGGTDFSIWLDGYTDVNFRSPSSGFNDLRNFDYRANTAHFSLGKLSIDHAPAPFGFHADIGFGPALSAIHAADPGPEGMKYIEQAYVSVKPKSWKGVQLDYGKFVTSAGAEVIEAYSNWNYSRSLLFAWAIPYYHLGLRATFPVGPHFTGGVQVVNGWNNDADNNSGKTIGITGAYAWKKVTWSNNYYTGPEKTDTNKGFRNLYDTTVQVNPNADTSLYVNFDWGRENSIGGGGQSWNGLAFAARRALGKKFAISPRVEFFNDLAGFSTGTKQNVKEVTLTGEYRATKWLVSRLEFRNDWSDKPFFDQGNGKFGKTQTTVLFGLLAYFGK